jgi:hypothetical protein
MSVKLISDIKGGIQGKNIWKYDHEANICAQEGWEFEVKKAPKWIILWFVPFTQYNQSDYIYKIKMLGPEWKKSRELSKF